MYAPDSSSTSVPSVTMIACVFDGPFTLVWLRAALGRLRWRSVSGPDETSGQAPLNLLDPALIILLKRFNEIWTTGCISRVGGEKPG